MSNCTGRPADEWLEQYLQGTLPAHEQEQFEEHYFDCPVCLARVQALQAAQIQLGRHPVSTLIRKSPIAWPIRVTTIAAMLLIGFIGYRIVSHQASGPGTAANPTLPATQAATTAPQNSTPPASPNLSQLADLTPPAYRPSNLRGTAEDSAFAAGMKAYSQGDCPRAVSSLSAVRAPDGDSLAASFYTGVCLMHEQKLSAAQDKLRQVAAAGDSPEQEAALYYLAQVELARNDTTAASRALGLTVALHGDFERRARIELATLPAPAKQP
jgi:anti-sigma factor RsiW